MSDRQHLDASMSELRSQIDALRPDDEQSRQHLSELVARIEARLATTGELSSQEDLGENMNASVLHFEVTHPRIAAILNQLAEKLGTMGI
ncbi:MAG: DUF4404 family protein [Caldimonas sp.]